MAEIFKLSMRRTTSLVATMVFTLLVVASAADARSKERYCNWKDGITEARLGLSETRLYREGDPRVAAAVAEHLPLGLPGGAAPAQHGEHLLAQPQFVIWYDDDLRATLWTAHHLSKEAASVTGKNGGEKRADSFRSDPRLPAVAASQCADYKEPIFDQGHMVPNADLDFILPGMKWSLGMDHSFLMSNMTPQHCATNRGPWQVLEGLVRDWAGQAQDTWIITAAAYDRDGTPGRDPDDAAWRMDGKDGRRVAIPSHLIKIVGQWSEAGWRTLTVIVPNVDTLVSKAQMQAYLANDVATLQQAAMLTGFRFFDTAQIDEANSLWPVAGTWPGPLTSGCKAAYPDR